MKRRSSKVLFLRAAAVLLIAVVGLAGAAGAEKTKIVYWHALTDQHEEGILRIIEGFNQSQDEYEVVVQQQPLGEFDAKLMQAVRIGVGPDLVTMFPSDAINYIADGLLVDLAPYINHPEYGIPNFKESINSSLYAEITQWGDEQIFMFPVTMTGEVLFYNKTLFDKYDLPGPRTWSKLEEASRVIYENEGIPGFGTDSITDTFQCLIMQAGSGYIDAESKRIAVDEEIAKDKLRWFTKGVEEGYFRLVGEDVFFSNPFGSQAVASYIGSSAGSSYVELAVDGAFELGCVPVPQEGPVKYISQWASSFVSLSKDEERARGTYEFFKYLGSTDVVVDWSIAFGAVPVYYEAVAAEKFQDFIGTDIAIKALVEEMDYVGMLASIPGASNVRTEIDKMIQRVALGVMDIDAAYADFVRAAQAALQR
ncbi:MAG: extracellular solute-binding protein [Firmicutes bacterium]|nr:extracellular solute-binding protein [Bacillota bacterium]